MVTQSRHVPLSLLPRCQCMSRSSSTMQSPSAHAHTLTWSDHCLNFGQHRLHHHPRMYTRILTCPSASHPWSILPPFVPWFKPRVYPSPLLVHRAQISHLTFSIAIDRLTLNICTSQSPETCCTHISRPD
jgi:hypothetical protein